MDLVEILMIAAGLAMDACAVSLAAAAAGHAENGRAVFRLAFHFGLFQFMMPVIGWFVGNTVAHLVSSVDHWVAFGLLAFVGGRMIRSGLDPEADAQTSDPSRGWTLMALCVATSIDAMAIGLSLAMLRVAIWYPSAVIGAVTSGLSLLALRVGARLGTRFGSRMEIAGGIILVVIGIRIVFQHIAA
jgi:manganese efflux pump family protein